MPNNNLKSIGAVVVAFVTVGSLFVGAWAFFGGFETKGGSDAKLAAHNQSTEAHKELIREWLIPMVVEEVEKRHHKHR